MFCRDGTLKKASYVEIDQDGEEEGDEEEAESSSASEAAEPQGWASLNDLANKGAAAAAAAAPGVALTPGTHLMWSRSPAQRSSGLAMLPNDMARRLARKGGLTAPGPGVRWKHGKPLPQLAKRLRWVTAVERCTSTAQLALQMRVLDSLINWEGLKRPTHEGQDPEWYHANITARRGAAGGREYLVVKPHHTGNPFLGMVTASKMGEGGKQHVAGL